MFKLLKYVLFLTIPASFALHWYQPHYFDTTIMQPLKAALNDNDAVFTRIKSGAKDLFISKTPRHNNTDPSKFDLITKQGIWSAQHSASKSVEPLNKSVQKGAIIYRWQDAEGVTHMSNHKPSDAKDFIKQRVMPINTYTHAQEQREISPETDNNPARKDASTKSHPHPLTDVGHSNLIEKTTNVRDKLNQRYSHDLLK